MSSARVTRRGSTACTRTDIRTPKRAGSFGYGLYAFCAHIRNSTLPCGPVIGLVVRPSTAQFWLTSHALTSSQTRVCTSASRTTPPLPTSSRPASNCGLMSAMSCALLLAKDKGRSSTLAKPMKLASHTIRSTGSCMWASVKMRALVCAAIDGVYACCAMG